MKKTNYTLALMIVITSSHAQTSSYQFSGLTASLYADLTGVPDGVPYLGTLSYTLPEPDLAPATDLGRYRFSSFSIQIGSQIFSAAPGGEENFISIFNANGPTGYSTDDLQVQGFSQVSGTVGNYTSIEAFLVSFTDPTGSVFPNDALPARSLTRGDFQFANISVLGVVPGVGYLNFGGSVDQLTLVPEPSPLMLCLGGFGIAALIARQRIHTKRTICRAL